MPQLIREYIAEMKLHLEYLTRQPELPLGEKLDFLRETRHCYGRTALVLSGGGALGVFHLVRVLQCSVLSSLSCRSSTPYVHHMQQASCSRSLLCRFHPSAQHIRFCICAGRGQGAVRQWAAPQGPVGQQRGLHQCVSVSPLLNCCGV